MGLDKLPQARLGGTHSRAAAAGFAHAGRGGAAHLGGTHSRAAAAGFAREIPFDYAARTYSRALYKECTVSPLTANRFDASRPAGHNMGPLVTTWDM